MEPADLWRYAAECGVDVLAITDHDTLGAYETLEVSGPGPSILVGIEVSTKNIYQVIEIGNNETRTTLTARDMRTDETVGDSAFTFDEKKYTDMNYLINR